MMPVALSVQFMQLLKNSNPSLDFLSDLSHPFNPYLGTPASEDDYDSYAIENGFKEEAYDSSQRIEKSIAKLLLMEVS